MSQVIQSVEEKVYPQPVWQCNYQTTSKQQMEGAEETYHKARFSDFFMAQIKRDGELQNVMFVVWTTSQRRTVYERVAPVESFEDFDSTRMDSVCNGLRVADNDCTEMYWVRNMTIIPSRKSTVEEIVKQRLNKKLASVMDFTATLDEDTDLSQVELPKSTLWKSQA
jgi:hypothetical protein